MFSRFAVYIWKHYCREVNRCSLNVPVSEWKHNTVTIELLTWEFNIAELLNKSSQVEMLFVILSLEILIVKHYFFTQGGFLFPITLIMFVVLKR